MLQSLDFLRVAGVYAVRRIHPLGNLIDVHADLLYLGGVGFKEGILHLDDIAVDEHLAGVCAEVLRLNERHLLAYQTHLILSDTDVELDAPCLVWFLHDSCLRLK